MITNVNLFAILNTYVPREISLSENFDTNSEYIMQILDNGKVYDTPVFFTWNTDNALYPYNFKYELVDIQGIIENCSDLACSDVEGVQVLRNFEGFGEHDSPSMNRLGKVARDNNSRQTVVGFIGSVCELPVNSPILTMLSREDYEKANVYRVFNKFLRMRGVSEDPRLSLRAVSIEYNGEIIKAYGMANDEELSIPEEFEDEIAAEYMLIENPKIPKMPSTVRYGNLPEGDTRKICGYFYAFKYYGLPLEDCEEEEIRQIHFM